MRGFFVAAALAGLTHLHTQVAAAQNSSRLSVDLDATLYGSHGGMYRGNGGVGLDLLGAFRFRESSSGAWMAAAGAGFHQMIGGDAICFPLKTGTGCAPDLPSLSSWTALAGWESRHAGQAGLRLLVGPALYSGGGSANVGATMRADLATPTLFHVALTATGRGSLVSLPGGATSLWAMGIGVRLR
jgi:hypothetical protein